MLETYGDKVRYVVKNYPYKYRDHARIAAQAFLAAMDQGKGWEMQDLLLDRSPKLDRESLIGYAKELGLDMARFTADLDTKKHDALIDQDLALAQSLDLYNTPTFFINGRRVIGNRSFEFLKTIIDEELHHARKQ